MEAKNHGQNDPTPAAVPEQISSLQRQVLANRAVAAPSCAAAISSTTATSTIATSTEHIDFGVDERGVMTTAWDYVSDDVAAAAAATAAAAASAAADGDDASFKSVRSDSSDVSL